MTLRMHPVTALVVGLFLGGSPLVAAVEVDGKKVFLDQKCNLCHAVSSADIQATGKIKAPDLAGAGAKHDAAKLAKFLKKEEPIKDKKHIKPFTGTDEELAAVVAWLQKQNAPEKTK